MENSYSKRKQETVARKTVVEKENKQQLLEIELFKKKTCSVCPHETEEKKHHDIAPPFPLNFDDLVHDDLFVLPRIVLIFCF